VDISSPKLGRRREGVHGWYSYYAGFSDSFVNDAIEMYSREADSVLDPWNGSGTTTYISKSLKRRAFGVDINPALVIVAKAKLIDPEICSSLSPLAKEICGDLDFLDICENDGLSHWFSPSTVRFIRSLEVSIFTHLVSPLSGRIYATDIPVSSYSPLASIYYLALFRLVRRSLYSFKTSNPTWIKVAKDDKEKIEISDRLLQEKFCQEVESFRDTIKDQPCLSSGYESYISQGSSRSLCLEDQSIDCVVSSPPYCTRIDYVRATLPELAVVMRTDPLVNFDLKFNTIGSTTNGKKGPSDEIMLGESYSSVLDEIRKHKSKASSTYYYRYFSNYFNAMYASIREVRRVLKPNSNAVLVVQDSYYKDVHIDLPSIISDIGEEVGFDGSVFPLHVDRNPLSGIHKHVKKYRPSSKATESMVVLST